MRRWPSCRRGRRRSRTCAEGAWACPGSGTARRRRASRERRSRAGRRRRRRRPPAGAAPLDATEEHGDPSTAGGRSAAPVEDHAPDPPDPLNDSQPPHQGEPRPRGRRSRKAGPPRPAPAAPLQGQARRRARHRARGARDAAERLRGRGDHLRRLLARAGGVPGRAGPAAVHLDAPAGVVGGALDQRGRARRPDPHPGDRREVPPAPAGDRGRAPRPAAAEGPGVRRDRQLPGPALHRRSPDRDAGGRASTASRSASSSATRRS